MHSPRLDRGMQEHCRRLPIWIWVGALVLIGFAIFSIYQFRRGQRELVALHSRLRAGNEIRRRLSEEKTLAERSKLIVSDPASLRLSLQNKSAHRAADPPLRVFWHPEAGVFVYGSSVAAPSPGKVFQLWFVARDPTREERVQKKSTGQTMMSGGTFGPDATGQVAILVFEPPARISDTASIVVSEEPIGGSSQPTSKPLWTSTFR